MDNEEKLVPMKFIRGAFPVNSSTKLQLVVNDEEDGYRLIVNHRKQKYCVARGQGDCARNWRTVDSALGFIKSEFGMVKEVVLTII